MNEYYVKVNFEKGLIQTNLKKLVQNDYNSTKLNFTFDKEGRVLFKLLRPDNSQYVDEIQNNTLVFGPGILSKEGTYEYEISLYTEDGRLTGYATKSFEVRSELVNTDEIVEVDNRLPILDSLITEANQINNIDIDIEDSVITIKRKDGTTKTKNVKGDAYVITDKDMQEIETNVISDIQPILDEAIENSDTAISISKGANQALSFGDYATMISVFNALNNDTYRVGQNILIVTLNVPDLWISEVLEESIDYTYTTDEDLTNLLKEQGYIQVGYYKLSALETQKVDLTEYVKFTDVAREDTLGLVKVKNTYGLRVTSAGYLIPVMATDKDIDDKSNITKPIVPSNLDYAVGSVFPIITQTDYDKLVANGTVNENLYYCIVEE